MSDDQSSPPSRADVENWWIDLIEGRVTREAAHLWAVPWVEGDGYIHTEAMVESGLQRLHGFDMTHDPETPNRVRRGGPGQYLHSDSNVAEELERWRAACVEYDQAPERLG